MDDDFGVSPREPLEIFTIPGQDAGSSHLNSMRYHQGIHSSRRAGRAQETAGGASMDLAGLGNRADSLEHPVDGSIARPAADRLGHDDDRNIDLPSQFQDARNERPSSLISPGEGDDGSGVENQALRRLALFAPGPGHSRRTSSITCGSIGPFSCSS